MTGSQHELVVLVDVDNTLIDNDQVKVQIDSGLAERLGSDGAHGFWQHYETVRRELNHIDVYLTLERLSQTHPNLPLDSARAFFLDFPFRAALLPGALDVLRAIWEVGVPVILSDGDLVYQRAKIDRAGISDAVAGNVLIYEHKEEHVQDVLLRFPAQRYWHIDDKARLLGKVKAQLRDRVTTVQVAIGRYAAEAPDPGDPAPDFVIQAIRDLPRLLPMPGRP